jgi:hypothetical protein
LDWGSASGAAKAQQADAAAIHLLTAIRERMFPLPVSLLLP